VETPSSTPTSEARRILGTKSKRVLGAIRLRMALYQLVIVPFRTYARYCSHAGRSNPHCRRIWSSGVSALTD